MCIIITALVVLCLCQILKKVYERMLLPLITNYWFIPRRIHKKMYEQRVPGPSLVTVATNIILNKFFRQDNSINNHETSSINHAIFGRLFPQLATWADKYGKTFFYSNWLKPRIWLTKAKAIREFLFRNSPVTGNTGLGTEFFIGQRLLMKLGLDWPQRRYTLRTVFDLSKIQEWVSEIAECTQIMLQQLQDRIDGNDEIEISQFVNVLTAHIMSRTEFGTSSEQGIQIAQLLNQMQERRAQSTWHSRFSQYNRELKALEVQVEEVLREMIQQRVNSVAIGRTNSHGNDLLGILLDEMHEIFGFIKMDLIVDECKTSLFAGHEANTVLITWTIMLLACNPSWQDRVRAEVNDVCHGHPPTPHNLSKLGLLNMVIKESLRLYPPVPIIERMAFKDIRIRHNQSDDFLIPKGVSVLVPVLAINHCEEVWGSDVNEFNPQRFCFNSSVEARRHFFPFAAGPQHCPAQYYALMEAKIFLAMFLSKFRFTISQNYRHAPVFVALLKPKYGVQINLTTL